MELSRGPFHLMPAPMHLRLLHVLANDAAGCFHLRNEIQRRLDVTADLIGHKAQAEVEVRDSEGKGRSAVDENMKHINA